MTDPLGSVKILTDKTYYHKVVPILFGGETVEEAKDFCKMNNILFFSSITNTILFL